MKYIDILKKYDKAIVSESQKLSDIYNEICNQGRSSDPIVNEEEEEKAPEENPEKKDCKECKECKTNAWI